MRLSNTNNFSASFNVATPYQMVVIHSSKLIYPRELYQRGIQRKRVELIARDFRKLSTLNPISRTGLSPSVAGLSRPFQYRIQYHLQAHPISLAATFRISVDFFSCSYLDVSVRCVRLLKLCIHFKIPLRVSSLIRTSVDQCSLASSPRLFAGCDVLHRL